MQHEPTLASANGQSGQRRTNAPLGAPVLWARVLAVSGAVLTGLPLVAPFVLLVASVVTGGRPRLDFLMPGELVGVVLTGGIALVAAAVLGRSVQWPTAICLALIVLLFGLIGVAADATGLASGATRAEGWPLLAVGGAYALYVLAVLAETFVGVLLCRRLFASGRP